jgi:hypothetical protein
MQISIVFTGAGGSAASAIFGSGVHAWQYQLGAERAYAPSRASIRASALTLTVLADSCTQPQFPEGCSLCTGAGVRSVAHRCNAEKRQHHNADNVVNCKCVSPFPEGLRRSHGWSTAPVTLQQPHQALATYAKKFQLVMHSFRLCATRRLGLTRSLCREMTEKRTGRERTIIAGKHCNNYSSQDLSCQQG